MRIKSLPVLLIGLVLLPGFSAHLMANAGMHLVKQGLQGAEHNRSSDGLFSAGKTILEQIPNDNSSKRGRAIIAMTEGDLATASSLWQLSGAGEWLQQRGDAIELHGSVDSDSTIDAMNWYLMAESMGHTNPDFWQGVGRLCRMDRQRSSLCLRFLEQNNGNLLLNPDFSLALDGWTVPTQIGAKVNIVNCDGELECAQILSRDTTPSFAATLFQCMTVETDAIYEFSAEISLTHNDPSANWLPLYIQGSIDGNIHDFRDDPPAPQDSSFHTYTKQFVALDFDDGLICLHPARFEGAADILVKNLRLERQ